MRDDLLLSVSEPLVQASQAVLEAGHGDILAKQKSLNSLAGGLSDVSRAVSMVSSMISEAGYWPEIWEPVGRASDAIRAAGQSCADAVGVLDSLLHMTVSDLAASQRQAPDQSELNGER